MSLCLDRTELLRLRALSVRTGAPVAELIRRGVRALLDRAERASELLGRPDAIQALASASDSEVQSLARDLAGAP